MSKELIEKLDALKQSTGNLEDDHSFNRAIKAAKEVVRQHTANLPPERMDDLQSIRGFPMSAIKIGMKLRSTTSSTFPVITVTEITENGFKYSHSRHYWTQFAGWSEEGECYGQDGYSFYKLVEPPKQDQP